MKTSYARVLPVDLLPSTSGTLCIIPALYLADIHMLLRPSSIDSKLLELLHKTNDYDMILSLVMDGVTSFVEMFQRRETDK